MLDCYVILRAAPKIRTYLLMNEKEARQGFFVVVIVTVQQIFWLCGVINQKFELFVLVKCRERLREEETRVSWLELRSRLA